MKLLLDSHIWVWAVLEPDRLKKAVRGALDDPKNELWLSPISVWEVGQLADRRRMIFDGGVEAWIAEARAALPVREASVTHEIAVAIRSVTLPQRDPADRFLVATARVLGLTFVTADEQIISAKQVPMIANR